MIYFSVNFYCVTEVLHSMEWMLYEALVCYFFMMEHFHFSKQAMLSTWCLRMYWMPLWCWWEAKPVGNREIETKNCLSKPGSRVRSFQCVADPAAGSSQCCVLMAGVAPLCLPAGSVSACVCRGKVHSGSQQWGWLLLSAGIGCQDAAQCCF